MAGSPYVARFSIDVQIGELRREMAARSQGLPRTGKAAGLSANQQELADRILEDAIATLVAVRDGALVKRPE